MLPFLPTAPNLSEASNELGTVPTLQVGLIDNVTEVAAFEYLLLNSATGAIVPETTAPLQENTTVAKGNISLPTQQSAIGAYAGGIKPMQDTGKLDLSGTAPAATPIGIGKIPVETAQISKPVAPTPVIAPNADPISTTLPASQPEATTVRSTAQPIEQIGAKVVADAPTMPALPEIEKPTGKKSYSPQVVDKPVSDSVIRSHRQSTDVGAEPPVKTASLDVKSFNAPAVQDSNVILETSNQKQPLAGNVLVEQSVSAASERQAVSTVKNVAQPTVSSSIPTPTEQVRAAVLAGGMETRIEVQLDPPELGRLQIDFEITRQGTVKAIVSAMDPEALDLLRRQQDDFAGDLTEQGFDEVDIQFAQSSDDDTEPGPPSQQTLAGQNIAESSEMTSVGSYGDHQLNLSL